jgi:hypothetical protein
LDRSVSFLLEDECPRRHGLTVADVAYAQLHQVTSSKLGVDRQIEQGEIPAPARDLQAYTDRPNLLEFEWGFLAN